MGTWLDRSKWEGRVDELVEFFKSIAAGSEDYGCFEDTHFGICVID